MTRRIQKYYVLLFVFVLIDASALSDGELSVQHSNGFGADESKAGTAIFDRNFYTFIQGGKVTSVDNGPLGLGLRPGITVQSPSGTYTFRQGFFRQLLGLPPIVRQSY